MRIFYLAIAGTYSLVMLAQQSASALKSISNNMQTAGSVTYLGNNIIKGFSYIAPDEEQQLKQLKLQHNIEVLKAEENLKTCLVDNAFKDREQGKFPTACEELAYTFIAKAGVIAASNLRIEFNEAVSELPKPVIQKPIISEVPSQTSWTKRLLVGGAIVVLTGGVAFFASPFLFPGTKIASMATSTTQAIQTSATTIGVKAVATGSAAAATIAGVAMEAKTDFQALSTVNKLKVTTDVMKQAEFVAGTSEYIGSYIIETNEAKLQKMRFEATKPMKERIERAHFKDKK